MWLVLLHKLVLTGLLLLGWVVLVDHLLWPELLLALGLHNIGIVEVTGSLVVLVRHTFCDQVLLLVLLLLVLLMLLVVAVVSHLHVYLLLLLVNCATACVLLATEVGVLRILTNIVHTWRLSSLVDLAMHLHRVCDIVPYRRGVLWLTHGCANPRTEKLLLWSTVLVLWMLCVVVVHGIVQIVLLVQRLHSCADLLAFLSAWDTRRHVTLAIVVWVRRGCLVHVHIVTATWVAWLILVHVDGLLGLHRCFWRRNQVITILLMRDQIIAWGSAVKVTIILLVLVHRAIYRSLIQVSCVG